MKNLDYNQINIFINLEIIGEEGKKKKVYLFFLNLKKFLQFSEATQDQMENLDCNQIKNFNNLKIIVKEYKSKK